MSGLPLVWSNDCVASIWASGGSSLPSRLRQLGTEAEVDDRDADARSRQAVRLQGVRADALDSLRDDLVGHGHVGGADAAHARQALYAIGQAGSVAHLQERARTRGDRRAEPGERTADARRVPGGDGDGERASRRRGRATGCDRMRHPRDRAERRGCEHETAHAGSRYWTRPASPATAEL